MKATKKTGPWKMAGTVFLQVAIFLLCHMWAGAATAQEIDRDWDKELSALIRTSEAPSTKAEKFAAIAENLEAPNRVRRHAMIQCIAKLGTHGVDYRNIESLRKTLKACERYKELFSGQNQTQDKTVRGWMILAHLGLLGAGSSEATEELAKTIDEFERLGAPKWEVAYYRGRMCRSTGQREKALEYFAEALQSPESLDNTSLAAITHAYLSAGEKDKALEVLLIGFDNSRRDATRLRDMLRKMSLDDDTLIGIFPRVIRHASVVDYIVNKRVATLIENGDGVGALAYSKLLFDIMPVDQIGSAVVLMKRSAGGSEQNTEQAEKLAVFLDVGKAGPDGKTGTEDDLANPFDGLANPLPQTVKQALQDLLKQQVPTEATIYNTLKDIGTLYLVLGEYDNAIYAWRSAYAAATGAQTADAAYLIPRALKALDGNIVRANRYLLYQTVGPDGPDGKPGTLDDVANPLPEIHGSLPEQVRTALDQISQEQRNSFRDTQTRARAFFALGKYRQGLEQMRVSYRLAGLNEKTLAGAIRGIGEAINAYDGHIARANQYLLFQRYGAAGKDGQEGTADDPANPLPSVEKELANR